MAFLDEYDPLIAIAPITLRRKDVGKANTPAAPAKAL
jgi:hypothetical protein